MAKAKNPKPKNMKLMTRKELMEQIKQMESKATEQKTPVPIKVEISVPDPLCASEVDSAEPSGHAQETIAACPAVTALETLPARPAQVTPGIRRNDNSTIEAPSIPVHLPAEVVAGMQNPEIFNQPTQPQIPQSASQKARMLMSLPEIPCGVVPDKPMRAGISVPSGVSPLPPSTAAVPPQYLPQVGTAASTQPQVAPSLTQPIPQQPRIQNPVHNFSLQKKDIYIAMPCYKFTNPATMWVAVQLALDLGRDLAYYDMEMGDAMIYHARNKLADRFLKSGYTWMFFLDDDIIPPTGRANWMRYVGNLPRQPYSDEICGRHIVNRLLTANKTLVGGNYFGRQITGVPVSSVAWNPQEENLARSMMNMVRPVDWVGTGCMMIHRQVFLDIQAKFPNLAPSGQRKWWDFFLPTEHGGEDVSFCYRAKAAGHQPHLDMGAQCLHVGWGVYGAHNTGKKPEVVVS